MCRHFWVATALALSACVPLGYVNDTVDLTRPHPSAASCASQGLQLDINASACVMPPPQRRVASSAQARAPVAASSPAPTPNTGTANVPIEADAAIDDDLRRNAKLLSELVKFVRENDYRCDAVSAARSFVRSRGFSVVCNRFSNRYEIEDKGGHWIVNAK
jgi:hypothetical protein